MPPFFLNSVVRKKIARIKKIHKNDGKRAFLDEDASYFSIASLRRLPIRSPILRKTERLTHFSVHLGSAIAWHFEVRREWSLVTISTAQGRDAMTSMILNLRTALKSASLFRIMQSTNIISYYTMMIEEEESRNNAKIMRASILNLISTDPIIVHCSTPVKSKTPSRAQTPLPGQNSSFGADKCSDTLMQDVTDRLADLEM